LFFSSSVLIGRMLFVVVKNGRGTAASTSIIIRRRRRSLGVLGGRPTTEQFTQLGHGQRAGIASRRWEGNQSPSQLFIGGWKRMKTVSFSAG
jgi:hypothetical protein